MSDIIKSLNKKNVYKAIYESDGISKQSIASLLGLSMPTVNQNITYLKGLGLIHEDGEFNSTGGRRAKVIKCTYDAKIAIGLDITVNHLTTVLIDLKGNVLSKQRERLAFENDKKYFQKVAKIVNKEITKHNIPEDIILGVGISLPVIVETDNMSVAYASVIDVKNNFYDNISTYLNRKCLLFNDANCAGIAEVWGNKALEDIIYLSLSNSVGGAIINKGYLLEGDNFRAGEFGHIKIVPNGKKCYCGNQGCADSYIKAGILSDLEDGNMKQFFKELDNGNVEYKKVFDEYLYYLSIVISNLKMSFDKDIIVGGYIGRYIEPYFEQLIDETVKLNPFDKNDRFIKLSVFDYEASAYGAGLKFIDDFLREI